MNEVNETKYSRDVEIGKYRIQVHQRVGFNKEQTWQEATVNAAATGSLSWRDAMEFSNELKEAVELARHWTQERAGKPVDQP